MESFSGYQSRSLHVIVVSDALQYSPEKCTIIATYKNLVVGAAFLSSPQETYITYLAVRAGWENAQIATYARLPPSLYVLNSNVKATTTLGRCSTTSSR